MESTIPSLYNGVHKQVRAPVAGFIAQFFRTAAGCLKNLYDLFVGITGRLSKADPFGYLHVIKTICGQKDQLCVLYLSDRESPTLCKSGKDGTDSFRDLQQGGSKWHGNIFFAFYFYYAICW